MSVEPTMGRCSLCEEGKPGEDGELHFFGFSSRRMRASSLPVVSRRLLYILETDDPSLFLSSCQRCGTTNRGLPIHHMPIELPMLSSSSERRFV